MSDCRLCGEPATDAAAVLGRRCTRKLEEALGDVTALGDSAGGLAEELETTLTRQSATSQRVGGRSAVTPLPYSSQASDAIGALRVELVAAVRILLEAYPDQTVPVDTLAGMSRWLLGRVPALVHHEAGDTIAGDLIRAVGRAERVVDLPAEQVYVGPCDADGCPGEPAIVGEQLARVPCSLYAEPGAGFVRCRQCGATYDRAARGQELLKRARDVLATAAILARAHSSFGEPVNADRLRQWASRGRIAVKGHDPDGRPLYRVGDVTEILIEETRRQAEKQDRMTA